MKNYADTVTFAGTEFIPSGLKTAIRSPGDADQHGDGGHGDRKPRWSDLFHRASAAVGTGLGNYYIHYANGILTVKAIDLTITAKDANKNYGDTKTFNGNEFIPPSGLKNSDTVTSVTLTSTERQPPPPSPRLVRLIHRASEAVGTGLGQLQHSLCQRHSNSQTIDLTIAARCEQDYGDTPASWEPISSPAAEEWRHVTSVTLTARERQATATVTAPGPTYPIVPSAAVGTGLGNYNLLYVDAS